MVQKSAQSSEKSQASNDSRAKSDAEKDRVHMAVRGLKKSYGKHEILRGIDLDLLRGQVNIIIGGSGSGKTVLLRQLARLEQPNEGHIYLDGQDLVLLNEFEMLPVRRKLGIVFQDSALFDSMTVYDNIAFPLREHTKLKAHEIHERVDPMLKTLGIDHAVAKLPSEISGGMKKRVAVARALMLEPALLFYDEPTTGLDPLSSRTVDTLIAETQERFGITSVVVTHDMESVFSIGDIVHFLFKGEVAESSTREEILRSNHPIVKEFLEASGVSAASRSV